MGDLEKKEQLERKDKFLIEMYKEQFKHIDRHINFTWQSVSVLAIVGSTILATIKYNLNPFWASMLIIFSVVWTISKLHDAYHWYERHIHIVSNIECRFLEKSDKRDVHMYFEEIRTKKNNLEWIELQKIALYTIWLLSFFFYLFYPDPIGTSFIEKFLSLLTIIISSYFFLILIYCYKKHNIEAIDELRETSPGPNRIFKEKKLKSKAPCYCKKMSAIRKNITDYFEKNIWFFIEKNK